MRTRMRMGQFEDFLEYDSSKMNYSPPPYVISHHGAIAAYTRSAWAARVLLCASLQFN